MEDGGCGFARARGCRESVFCVLGVCLNVLPFFLEGLCFVSDS